MYPKLLGTPKYERVLEVHDRSSTVPGLMHRRNDWTLTFLRAEVTGDILPKYPLFPPPPGDFTRGSHVAILIVRYAQEHDWTIYHTAAPTCTVSIRGSSTSDTAEVIS